MGAVNERIAQNWFRCFEEGDSSLEKKTKPERPSAVENDALYEMVEEQPSTSNRNLSAERSPLESIITQHLHKLGLVNKQCQEVSHDLTTDQAQRRVDLCQREAYFGHRILTRYEIN